MRSAAPSLAPKSTFEWILEDSDLKFYPQFDGKVSTSRATSIVNDPLKVAAHSFFPFIKFEKSWRRFAKNGEERKKKVRPIRYAARLDSYIFTMYRKILAGAYEKWLVDAKIADSIIAYRRVVDPKTNKGKSNIDFTKEAFGEIRRMGNCYCFALDISSFFESLDHQYLKTVWMRLLEVNRLPPDHFAVYSAITRYAVVDKLDVYKRLGYFGPKSQKGISVVDGYLTAYKDMPTQLCSPEEFRLKIAGGDGQKSIIKVNRKPYGIPQGAPISDLLANVYLFDFDVWLKEFVINLNGSYFRYSDDIFVVIPIDDNDPEKIEQEIRTKISSFGKKIKIKEEKSVVLKYQSKVDGTQDYECIKGEGFGNGVEYLGFRYDGCHVYLRDSTVSNLYRKVKRAVRSVARSVKADNPNLSADELIESFDFQRFMKRFGRVEAFDTKSDDYRNWTFWTYFVRARKAFDSKEKKIEHQLKNLRRNAKKWLKQDFERLE